MGFGGWGALAGLGQGLQQGAQQFQQARQQDAELKQRALQMALAQQQAEREATLREAALALQGQQLDLTKQGDERKHLQWVADNARQGSRYAPEVRQAFEAQGMGAFVQPEFGLDESVLTQGVPQTTNVDPLAGAPFSAGQPGVGDTGYGLAVPTESTRQRVAALNQQGSAARAALRAQVQIQLQAERSALAREREAAMAELRAAQTTAAYAAAEQRLARIQQDWARLATIDRGLDLREEELSADEAWRYNVVQPDLEQRRMLDGVRVMRPSGSSQGGILPPLGGGAPTPAPLAPAAPGRQRLNPKTGRVETLQPDGTWKAGG